MQAEDYDVLGQKPYISNVISWFPFPLQNLVSTNEVFMILKYPLSYIKKFFEDPTVRKNIFCIACAAAFSARFANG